MKNMKKMIAMLLCVLLLVGLMPAMAFAEEVGFAEAESTENEAAFAAADDDSTEQSDINILAEDGDSTGTDTSTDTDTEETEDIPVYASEDEIVTAIRDAMTDHAVDISFDITKDLGNQFRPEGELDDIVAEWKENLVTWVSVLADQALAHTGDPVQGDTLRWTIAATYADADPQTSMYTIWRFTVTFDWYTTAAEETELNAKVAEIIDTLNLYDIESDYDCVAAIYGYITANVEYEAVDYDADEPAYENTTAYGALVNGKADDLGIALAFYRLALEADIDTRVVFGYNADDEEMYCNIVKLGGSYYYIYAAADLGKEASGYTGFILGSSELEFEPDNDEITGSYAISDYGYSETKGDVNGDSKVDLADLLVLKKYLAGVTSAKVPAGAADLSNDGDITLVDLLMLKQVLAHA